MSGVLARVADPDHEPPADAAAPQVDPLIGPLGMGVGVDACADVINRTWEPFEKGPDPKAGFWGQTSHWVNAGLGTVGAPFDLLDTGFAMATSWAAELLPGMPAAPLMAPHLAPNHGHLHPPSLVPPAPMVPLPSLGMVNCAGCISVLLGGIPAARASDLGIAITCVGLFPFLEVYTGSSNTFIGGSRAARMVDVTRHCDPLSAMGTFGKAMSGAAVAAGALGAAAASEQGQMLQAASQAAQAAADATAMVAGALLGKDPGVGPTTGALVAGYPLVVIGGFPMPDTLDVLGGMLKKVGNLGKKLTKSSSKKAKNQTPKCDKPGHPIDPVTGAAVDDFIDYRAPQEGGLIWQRSYDSGRSNEAGPLGFGFRHFYQLELMLTPTGAELRDGDGRRYPFPLLAVGAPYEGTHVGRVLEQQSPTRFEVRFGGNKLRFLRNGRMDERARMVRWQRDGLGTIELTYHPNTLWLASIREELIEGTFITTLSHDASGRIIAVARGREGAAPVTIARYDYDRHGCLVRFTDALGHIARYGYDAAHRMIDQGDRRDYHFFYRYRQDGKCVEESGQDGLWHVRLRYGKGETYVTEHDGSEWTYVYNDEGTVTKIVDPNGAERLKVVDERGLVIKEIDSGGRVTELLYDEHGYHYARRNRWGHVLPTLDELPNPLNPLRHEVPTTHWAQQYGKVTDSLVAGDVLSPLPKAVRRIASETLRQAPVPIAPPRRVHDAAGRLVSETDALDRTQSWQYDSEGNLVAHTDFDGRTTHHHTTSWNLVGAETDALGNSIGFEYTPHKKIAAVIDPEGNRSDYIYDHRDRLVEVKRHGVTRERYTYDDGDRLIEKHDSNGNLLLTFKIGKNGLPRMRKLSSGEEHWYAYDDRGNITEASTSEAFIERRHDDKGRRITDKRDGRGVEHRYERDRLVSTTYFDRFVVHYHQDSDGSLRIETPAGGTHRISRDHSGAILRRLGSGTSELSSYGPGGRCEGRVVWRGENRIWGARYVYSNENDLIAVHDSARGVVKYDYDAAHRLVCERRSGREVSWTYDPAGNLTSTPAISSMTYREGNRLAKADGALFEHNCRNHISMRVDRGGVETHYHYNSTDQLVKVERSDGWVWTAGYDGLGRRMQKAQGEAVTELFWDGDRLVAEIGPTGRLRLYVYACPKALVPLLFIDYAHPRAEPKSGRAYFPFYNQVGVTQAIEDSRGRVVWWAEETDPYGGLVVRSSGVDYQLRWPGHYFDDETGLHDNRFRSYSPELGRYLQSDPAGQSGGENLYAYSANPMVVVDILGLMCKRSDATDEAVGELGSGAEQVRLKFTAWWHRKDGKPSRRWGHLTIKEGEGDAGVYHDFRSSGEDVKSFEPRITVDERDVKHTKLLREKHNPDEHAARFLGRPSKGGDLLHNARTTLSVQLKKADFDDLMSELEGRDRYSAYGEARDTSIRPVRCTSLLESLFAKYEIPASDVKHPRPRDYLIALHKSGGSIGNLEIGKFKTKLYESDGEGGNIQRTDDLNHDESGQQKGPGDGKRPSVEPDKDYW